MGVEYVKLSLEEKNYAEKTLLKSQESFILITQKILSYHKLRNEELKLKLDLKNKVQDAILSIDKLNQILPKSQIKIKESVKTETQLPDNSEEQISVMEPKEVKEVSLETELQEIRKRLSSIR